MSSTPPPEPPRSPSPPEKPVPRRGRPEKGNINQDKEDRKQKQREATRKSRERKKEGVLIRPRLSYDYPTAPKVTRKSVPLEPYYDEKKDGDTMESCSVLSAIQYLGHERPIELGDLAKSASLGEIPVQAAIPFWCQTDQSGSFKLYEPHWITATRQNLNRTPFQRTHLQTRQLESFNNNLEDWLMHNSVQVVENFFNQRGISEDSKPKSVTLEEIFHSTKGILSDLQEKFCHPHQGPYFPIPLSAMCLPPPVVTLPLSSNQPLRKKLGPNDEPFCVLRDKALGAVFGSFEDGEVVLSNSEMTSLFPDNELEATIVDVVGTIISDLTKSRPHSYPFHFIRTSEFHRTDSPLDDGEMDKLIARIKSEMVQGPHAGITRICCIVHTPGHFVVFIADRTTHQITLYDPVMNGGNLRRTETSILSHKLLKFGSLLSQIYGEHVTTWNGGVTEWKQRKAPPLLGVQRGAVDCAIYCLLFLEIISKLTEVCAAEGIKALEHGNLLSWDMTRKRYFNYVVKVLESQKGLRPQPSRSSIGLRIRPPKITTTLLTPTTELSFVTGLLPNSSVTSGTLLTNFPAIGSGQKPDSSVTFGGQQPQLTGPQLKSSVTKRVQKQKTSNENVVKKKIIENVDLTSDLDPTPLSHLIVKKSPKKTNFGALAKDLSMKMIRRMPKEGRWEIIGSLDNGNVKISYHDLYQLLPKIWLNDQIVNGLLHTYRRINSVTQGSSPFIVIDSNFVSELINDKTKPSRTNRSDSVYQRINMIRNFERLLIPYNFGGVHWTLIIVEFVGSVITLYDPYQSPNTVIDDVELVSALQGIQRCITRILQEGLTDKNNVVTSMTVNYTYMTTPLLGQQFHDPDDLENCDINNCGLFVTLFAMLYTNSPGFKHTLANALSSSELVPRNTGALALRQLFYGLLLRELERSENGN